MATDTTLRFHAMGHGRPSQPVLWGFETKELLTVAFGFAVAMGVFRLLYSQWGWSAWTALALALLPLLITLAWVTLMVAGKPKAYAGEFFEWHWIRHQLVGSPAYFAPNPPKTLHPLVNA